ncbi:DoxX family protein [Neisseria musculi]|uniref:DoxX family protein n=1 Tax=Neisseria musculi TaxID=1815583 RepID=A0A7H1MDS2_9NEIS|nr:DoxX family protein [Neisseria musculi]QNT59787.1 doxX family protein [Neisseria musculi]
MGVLSRFQPVLLSVLRITAAYMFMLHGTAKLFGLSYVAQLDGLPLMSLPGIAGIFETFGGLLLLLGLFVRPVAFILSGLMAAAYFIAHAPAAPLLPLINQGEPAALYSFVFLYLAAAGGGAWALDNKFKKAK